MKDLSNKTILFCGKERRFKRTTALKLKDASSETENIQKELGLVWDKFNEKVTKAKEIRVEANRLLYQTDPKTNSTIPANETKAQKLLKKAEKIEKEVTKESKELESQVDELNNRIIHAQGVVAATLMEPMSVEEFIENHDHIDMVIVKNLPMFYDMYMTGFSEKKIEQRLKQLIDAEHDALFR